MIAAAGNNAISDSDPVSYIPNIVATLGTESDAVFRSNLLPEPSSFEYSKASYEEFVNARIALVAATVETLCAGDHP